MAHCLSEHSFTNTRRAVKQNGLPRTDLTIFKELRALVRQHERHIDCLFSILVASDVLEADIGFGGQNTFPQCVLYFCVVGRAKFSVHVEANLIG